MNNDKTTYVDVVLTEQEAINGVQKEITLDGMQSPLKVNFPKNMKEGNILALRRVKISEKNGATTQKDVYIKIIIQKWIDRPRLIMSRGFCVPEKPIYFPWQALHLYPQMQNTVYLFRDIPYFWKLSFRVRP